MKTTSGQRAWSLGSGGVVRHAAHLAGRCLRSSACAGWRPALSAPISCPIRCWPNCWSPPPASGFALPHAAASDRPRRCLAGHPDLLAAGRSRSAGSLIAAGTGAVLLAPSGSTGFSGRSLGPGGPDRRHPPDARAGWFCCPAILLAKLGSGVSPRAQTGCSPKPLQEGRGDVGVRQFDRAQAAGATRARPSCESARDPPARRARHAWPRR